MKERVLLPLCLLFCYVGALPTEMALETTIGTTGEESARH